LDGKPNLVDLQSKFWHQTCQDALCTTAEPVTHEFFEFMVNTIPDLNELGTSCPEPTEGNSAPCSSLDPDFKTHNPHLGKQHEAPTQMKAKAALEDLQKLLKPLCKEEPGYINTNLDLFV
jgi:hypothetical protein